MTFSDLALQNSSSTVSGQGYATFGHALSFDLMTDTTGGLATRFGGQPDVPGVAHLRVPVKVRGTMESPKVYPEVTGMAKAAAVDQAKGLIDSFLNRRGVGYSAIHLALAAAAAGALSRRNDAAAR